MFILFRYFSVFIHSLSSFFCIFFILIRILGWLLVDLIPDSFMHRLIFYLLPIQVGIISELYEMSPILFYFPIFLQENLIYSVSTLSIHSLIAAFFILLLFFIKDVVFYWLDIHYFSLSVKCLITLLWYFGSVIFFKRIFLFFISKAIGSSYFSVLI